jgi:hypothetical protein
MAEPSFRKIIRYSVFVRIEGQGKTEGKNSIKSVYTALAVNFEGKKEVAD